MFKIFRLLEGIYTCSGMSFAAILHCRSNWWNRQVRLACIVCDIKCGISGYGYKITIEIHFSTNIFEI